MEVGCRGVGDDGVGGDAAVEALGDLGDGQMFEGIRITAVVAEEVEGSGGSVFGEGEGVGGEGGRGFGEGAGGGGIVGAVDHEVESIHRAGDFDEVSGLKDEGLGADIELVAAGMGEHPVHVGVGVGV